MPRKKAIVPELLSDEEKALMLADDQITKAVAEINKMVAKDVLSTAIKVGNFVIKTFFNNDINLAMSKDPTKAVSYRDLQNREDLSIRFNQLSMMVRIAAQDKIFPGKIDDNKIKLLTYSHRVELLQVQEEKSKIKLAIECIDNNLSVRDLHAKIKGDVSRSRSTEILPFNDMITDILNLYSDQKLNEDELTTYSYSKIDKLKSNVDKFVDSVDDAKKKLAELQKKINPIFNAKKKEKDDKAAKAAEPKKRGRPAKKKTTEQTTAGQTK